MILLYVIGALIGLELLSVIWVVVGRKCGWLEGD